MPCGQEREGGGHSHSTVGKSASLFRETAWENYVFCGAGRRRGGSERRRRKKKTAEKDSAGETGGEGGSVEEEGEGRKKMER